jgi:lipopolysaccharide biosynthesis regulator YciM
MLELGEDYLRAGLFDRAEALFQRTAGSARSYPDRGIPVDPHFSAGERLAPGDRHSDRLERIGGEPKRGKLAHFCCELAEEADARSEYAEARTWLLDALARDPRLHPCQSAVRAVGDAGGGLSDGHRSVSRRSNGRIGLFSGSDRAARSMFGALGRLDEWVCYLREVQSGIAAAGSRMLWRNGCCDKRVKMPRFISRTRVAGIPTLLGLRRLVESSWGEAKVRNTLICEPCIASARRCSTAPRATAATNCGFVVKSLHWCCPELPAVEHDQADARSGDENQRLRGSAVILSRHAELAFG